MFKLSFAALLATALMVAPQDPNDKSDSQDDPLAKIKCCMMPKQPVNKSVTTKFHHGDIYFCCAKCKAAFEKDKEKYAVRANLQLVQTKQFVQKACPIGGGKTDGTHVSKLGDLEISFCCADCKKEFDDAKDDEARINLVFSEDGFMKGYKRVRTGDDDDDADDEEHESDGG